MRRGLARSGQMRQKSVGKRSRREQMPRSSAIGASRISLSSGMRLFDFHSETEGGLTPASSATANVPPNRSIKFCASMCQLLGMPYYVSIGNPLFFGHRIT